MVRAPIASDEAGKLNKAAHYRCEHVKAGEPLMHSADHRGTSKPTYYSDHNPSTEPTSNDDSNATVPEDSYDIDRTYNTSEKSEANAWAFAVATRGTLKRQRC